jgi:DNA-binding CsgD family transcriptional regulator
VPLRTGIARLLEFTQTLNRVVRGGAVIDPALVHELVSACRRDDPLAVLGPRQGEVLAVMAAGRSNTGIARQLWVTERTVEKHVHSISPSSRCTRLTMIIDGARRDHISRGALAATIDHPTLSQIRAWIALGLRLAIITWIESTHRRRRPPTARRPRHGAGAEAEPG